MKSEKKTKMVREHMPYGRVLIVDDVDFSLSVAKGLMTPYGLTIETAISGYDALEKVRSGTAYDIIFMDYVMPEMDGIETTRLIREEGYDRPIIALTANIPPGKIDMISESGFNDFLSKPVNVRQLDVILNKWIRDKQPPEALARKTDDMPLYTADASLENTTEYNSIINKLRDIEYLNVDSALEAVNDLTNVLIDSIRLTARRLPETVEKMDELMSVNDFDAFITIVHGLKSVLKGIGALTLASNAANLEHAGLDGNISFCKELYPSFKDTLLSLSAALSEALQEKNQNIKSSGDKASLSAVLPEVKIAASNYNRDLAMEIITPYINFSYDTETDKQLNELFIALDEFDWIKAIDKLALLESG